MYPTMHFPGFLVLGGGGGGVRDMYDSKCDPDKKVIPKKTQIGPLIMCCTRLVNSVTDYYKWISTVYIMTFKSKQFQCWQNIRMYII